MRRKNNSVFGERGERRGKGKRERGKGKGGRGEGRGNTLLHVGLFLSVDVVVCGCR